MISTLRLAAMLICTILLRIFVFFSHDVSVKSGGHVGLHHTIAIFSSLFYFAVTTYRGDVSLIRNTFNYNVARATGYFAPGRTGILKVNILNIVYNLRFLFS